jgi:hypothetical protein
MKKFTKVWQLMMVLLLSSSVLLTQAQKNVSAERAPVNSQVNKEEFKSLQETGFTKDQLLFLEKQGINAELLKEAEYLLKAEEILGMKDKNFVGLEKTNQPASVKQVNNSSGKSILDFPWIEGFETVTIPALPPDWLKENGDWLTTNNANSTYDADAHSGTQFLRESWFATNEYVWTPGFALDAGTPYDLSFWWAGDDYSGWTGDVFYNTSQNSAGATQLGNSFVVASTTTTKIYAQVLYTFLPTTTGTYYFAIRVNCPSSAPWYLSFDDFRLEPSPSCPMPNTLGATNITTTTADLTWISFSGLSDIEIGLEGFTPTGIPTYAGVVSPYNVAGLSASTFYSFYVRDDCGGGEYSEWNGPFTFATSCDVFIAPYTQGFTTWPPLCWDMTGGTYSWAQYSSGVVCAMANFWSQASGNTDVMTTNTIDVSGLTSPVLVFDWSHYYNTTYPDDSIEVMVSDDNGASWTVVWSKAGAEFESNDGAGNTTPGTFVSSDFISLSSFEDQIKVRFFGYSGYGPNCYIDNVIINEAPTCPQPIDLGAINISTVSADLTWTSFSGLSDIEFGLEGFTPTGIPTYTGVVSPYNVTGLSASTSYSFYVRDDCGGGDYSWWVGPYTFATPCDVFPAPFLEQFTSWPPLCWDLTGGTYSWAQYIGSGVECAYANFWGQASGNTDIMTTPLIDISAGNFGLEFYWSHLYSSTYPLDALEVLVSDDYGTNWTQVWYKEGTDFNSNDGAGNTTPGTFVSSDIISLSSFESPIMVRFYGYSGYGPDVFIDNVNVFEVAYGDLAGTVTKLSNGTPVEGANISLGSLSTTTGSDGTYSITGILVGNYLVTCNALGYNIETANVTILENQLTTQDFSLTAPQMIVNPLSIEVEVEPNGQTDEFVNINNPGNGPLDWSAQIQVLNDKETLTDLVKGSQAYAFQIYPDPTAVVSFDTDDPGSFNTIAPTALDPFAGDFGTEDNTTLYIITYTNPTLYAIDITTGAETMIAPATGVTSGQNVSGMACDKTTGVMYASSTDISASDIYTVNLETGELTLIGTTGIPGIIEIAIDGTGTMYAWDIVNDEAFTVDKSTGASTLLGPLGYNLNYAQGGNWDPVSDVIYLAAYSASGQLMTMDKATGALTVIGDFPSGAEVDALAFPGGFSTWLSIDPHNGTIEAGNNTQMTVHFDATDMLPGVYQAEIHFSSNPNVGSPVINVTMTVAGLIPAINLSANFTCTDVELTWEMPTGGNPDSWNVYRDGVLLGNSTVMEYTDAMVMPNVLLSYYVKAVYAGEESMPSSTETITVPIPGSLQPIGLSASANTPTYGYVTLDWNEPNACLEPQGYHVYRDNVQITTTPVTDLTFIDGPLGAGLYEYKLKAVYYFGQSGFSTAAYALIPVGIEETDDDLFRIFPNPASQMVTIESAMEITGIKVFNNSGQVVLDEIVNVMNYQIDVSKFDKGIYYIRLETGDTKILRKITIN